MELTPMNSGIALTHDDVKDMYNTQRAAARYSTYFRGSAGHVRKDKREKGCIAKALAPVTPGALVLDLPCGTGRMYPLLKDMGFRVIGADSSAYMVDYARRYAASLCPPEESSLNSFCVADILKTDFQDEQFDAAVCNRLFHHFATSHTRQRALRELARICTGPIVVSFFSNLATDALKFYYKKYVRRKTIGDRIPISPATFTNDVRESGLAVEKWILPRPGLSMQWYVVLRKRLPDKS